MKNLFLFVLAVILSSNNLKTQTNPKTLNDGTYQVISLVKDSAFLKPLSAGQVIIQFDTLFNPGEYNKVIIDALDYVPMDLETTPSIESLGNNKKLLSVTLTPDAATKMKSFTAKRVMKHVVIVLDGKAITMHLIRVAITGNNFQITRCSDNACEYLMALMKNKIKK